jgi:hypothetical protein
VFREEVSLTDLIVMWLLSLCQCLFIVKLKSWFCNKVGGSVAVTRCKVRGTPVELSVLIPDEIESEWISPSPRNVRKQRMFVGACVNDICVNVSPLK